MRRSVSIGVAAFMLVGLAVADSAKAVEYTIYCIGREGCSWHANYYKVGWGGPVALVVPPTAEAQFSYGWGVGNTRVSPICPQFHRNWPGPASYDPRILRPTPRWPSDTDQFGVYYVHSPW